MKRREPVTREIRLQGKTIEFNRDVDNFDAFRLVIDGVEYSGKGILQFRLVGGEGVTLIKQEFIEVNDDEPD